jgi:hypothetical protein
MKVLNTALLDKADATKNQASRAITSGFLFQGSIQIISTGIVAGDLQLQVSNDKALDGDLGPFTPTTWANLGSAVSFSNASVNLIPKTDLSYQWLRVNYIYGSGTAGTITANLKALGD